MLVDRGHWWRGLRGSAIKRIWPHVLGFMAWASFIAFAELMGWIPGRISPVPFTFIGLPLGFFLAFRGNQGHARYWEARLHWQTICNCARNIARQSDVFLRGGDEPPEGLREVQREIICRVVAVVHATRVRLQGGNAKAAAIEVLNDLGAPVPDLVKDAVNVPYALLTSITRDLDRILRAGWIDRIFARYIDQQVAALSDAVGACDKIRKTPMPVPIVLLTRRMVLVYGAGLPIGIVDMTRWFTPVVVGVLVYAFLGLDTIAGQLAAPFDEGPHQLPLLTTAVEVERDVRQLLGLELPPLPSAHDGIVP
ncbi:MAG: bestrophin family protein [Myxococcales bacterium]|nr:bestrophin family protein [Myxococcales bacterium]